MNEENRITLKILSSLLTGNQKASEIREEAKLSPKTVAKYKNLLSKQKLITVPKARRGQSQPWSITDDGISWLINVPVNENLRIISKIVDQAKKAKNRELYQKTNSEIYAWNRRLIINHFIESKLKRTKPLQQPIDDVNLADPDQLFRDTLKKLLTLHIFLSLNSSDSETAEILETNIDKSFIIFAPKMRLWGWWQPGKSSEFGGLEKELIMLENQFLYKRINEPQSKRFRESHFLELDNLDESIFEEYLKAPDKITRSKVMKRIETQAGWDVSKYIKDLVRTESGLEKYFDEIHRPYFVKFLKSFTNQSEE